MTGLLTSLTPVLATGAEGAEPAEVGASTGLAAYGYLLFLTPAVIAIVLLLAGKRSNKWGHWLALLGSWMVFAIGLGILIQLLQLPAESRRMQQTLFTWISAGEFQVDFGILIDPLSMTFVMLVSFVGSLILVYSVGYMSHDPARRRFFAYLSLFIASMLMLVLGDSYTTTFLGWEGVGLCSYLLIGFWNHVPEYAVAAKKAFVMNRVGDMGLLIAMMTMVMAFHTTDYLQVAEQVGAASETVATVIGLALLLAACGKSAQFPLQAWLGDAMAGPTPVSALIHAATMVTAGAYLVVRSGAVFEAAPIAATVVAIIGLLTAILGAAIGCAKDDIKKALAASTMSQIGYMMLGAGLGPIGWAFAIFHLLTHGFFKALMFLGAGSVMHAMSDQTNMRRFGALRKVMVVTWLTFMMGWLAILGIPPFSGFWSKDLIIEAAFSATAFGHATVPWLGWVYGLLTVFAAALTAFYMSRLFFLTFHGKARWTTAKEGKEVHPHESPASMTTPMIILALFAIALGGVLSINDMFVTWLEPTLGAAEHAEPVLPVIYIQILTVAVVVIAAVIAWMMYGHTSVAKQAPRGSALTRAARRDFYQDAVNEAVFMTPSLGIMKGVVLADRQVIDGVVRGVGWLTHWLGKVVTTMQTGYTRAYASYVLGGVVIVLAIVLGFRLF